MSFGSDPPGSSSSYIYLSPYAITLIETFKNPLILEYSFSVFYSPTHWY